MFMAAFADGALNWGTERVKLEVAARLAYEAPMDLGQIRAPIGPYMAMARSAFLTFEPSVSLQYKF